MSKELQEELKERLGTKTLVKRDGSASGCINKGISFTIDNDEIIFVKSSANHQAATMFDGEFASLKQINLTSTIRAPKPLAVIHNYDETGASAIAMEFLDIVHLSDDGARKLGEDLAKLHDYNSKVLRFNERASKWVGGRQPSARRVLDKSNEGSDNEPDEEENQFAKHNMRIVADKKTTPDSNIPEEYPTKFIPEPGTEGVEEFGFDLPTSCGLIPQINEWTNDWVSFFARYRLDKPIRSLLSDHGDRELTQLWSHLQLKVDKFFVDLNPDGPDKIVPALLHGDLWSGNVAQLRDSYNCAVYDPSAFYGHSEYDFGIARMFGGIPKSMEESYFQILPKKKLFEKRNKLYQLFHHLNHWDHFGSGYRSSSLRLLKELNEFV